MAKPTFSPTKFAIYLRCPLQYRLAYVDKLARFYGRARAVYSFGSTLHRTLQTFHEQGGSASVSLDDLIERYRGNWQSAGFATKEEEKRQFEAGHAILLEYYSAASEQPSETILTEKMLRQDRGHFILTGKIDRLDRLPDGTLEVIDYKSGRSSLSEEEVANELGLMVYETLVRAAYPDTNVRVALVALRAGLKISIERSSSEVAEIGAFLDALATQIIADELYPGRPGEQCDECDFRKICPVFTRTGHPVITAD